MAKKEQHMAETIGPHYIIIIVALIIVFSAVLIYQNTVINKWKGKYQEVSTELNHTEAQLTNVSNQFQKLQEDVQRYDRIYGQKRAEAKYAKEIALLELSHQQAEYRCIEPITMEYTGFPELKLEAEANSNDGWPVLHVFVDGKHSSSFEVKNENATSYSTRLKLYEENHTVDIVYPNAGVQGSETNRKAEIHNITINNQPLKQSQTFYDEGSGPLAFNCYSPYQTWDLNTNGAIRFSLSKD